ncbi:ferric reductase NAD binding domain-containing protein [Gloeopeniophorella convolvens]|nr:ferric reductase NAD binding domain-containing protein [Gloeopeniophorella convolvens]
MSLLDIEPLSDAVLASRATVSTDKTIRKHRAALYPKQTWYFVGSIIGLAILLNVFSLLGAAWRRRRASKDAEGQGQPPTRAISIRHVVPAVVNAWRIIAYRSVITLPFGLTINLVELFLTAAYTAALFTWSLINTTTMTGARFDPNYFANRAGCIAAIQLPLVVALGMRNNIIAFVTGINHQRLSYLHRMGARVICVLLWLHAGGRVRRDLLYGGLYLHYSPQIKLGLDGDDAISDAYVRCGITALVALTSLTLVSVRPIRKQAYELFYLIHITLVMIILLGAYFHARDMVRGYYVWPTFILWGLDRVTRVVRLVVFNHSYFGLKSGLGTFNATVEPLTPGFARLRFARPKHLHWLPGQNAYLTMPGVSHIPFESHPFTIANADLSGILTTSAEELDEKVVEKGEDDSPASHGKDLVFVVQAREGFTKRLGDMARTGGSLKVFIDGPYGAPPRLFGYDTVVFVAGGSGITFTSPLFVDLIHCARLDPSICRRIVFVWAIREAEQAKIVYNDLMDTLTQRVPSLQISVHIHITGNGSAPSSEAASVSSDEEDITRDKIARLPHTSLSEGRPDVRQLIEDAASLAHGDMAVNVCGPADLSASVRKVLRSSIAGPLSVLKGGPSVNLHVEEFGYAPKTNRIDNYPQ